MLTALLRREGDGGYEQLVAGRLAPYETRYDQQLEILTEDLAGDLAEALTAGASGLVRRYYWPKAFLPPQTILGPANVLAAAGRGRGHPGPADRAETSRARGWVSYAIVDDLDPGAVLDLIRLRRGRPVRNSWPTGAAPGSRRPSS
jgi:hypothetical protein